MLLEIHPHSPQSRYVNSLVKILTSNGVIIFPIDTAYVFCCALSSKKAMKRIYQLKNGHKNTHLTFVCNKTKQFQEYTTGLSNQVFRKIKSSIPGPYIFIFEASKKIPKTLLLSRPVIGVKIPESPLSHLLVGQMDEPLLTCSIPKEGTKQDLQNGYSLHEQYEKLVDCVVDSGELYPIKSAVIDFTHSPPEIIRVGDVDISWL